MREQPSEKELNINQLAAHNFLGLRLQSLHLRRPFQRVMPFKIVGDAALFCKPAHQRTDLIVCLAVDAGKVLYQRTIQQHLVAFKGAMFVKKARPHRTVFTQRRCAACGQGKRRNQVPVYVSVIRRLF